MNRPSYKRILFCFAIVAALLAVTDLANAWWGCCPPVFYGCCSPCYSCWDSCCGCDGWYLGWRPGPIRRLLFGPYRWYYGGCGYSGYCCGSYTGCCDVECCGAAVPGTAPAQPTPAQKPVMEAPKPAAPLPMEVPKETTPPLPPSTPSLGLPETPSSLEPAIPTVPELPKSGFIPTPENSGVITVWVPFDAKVSVNGLLTKSTGSRRQFVSYGLKPGFSYKYNIHAEVVRSGQIVEENRTVVLTMGQDTAVVFGFNTAPVENIASTR
jgi:uncharacterized protein (TIGR03000 family)